MMKTVGVMTKMNLIMSQVNRLTPLSKLVCTSWVTIALAIPPRYVFGPVAVTTPCAEPLSTLVPRKQVFFNSSAGQLFVGSTASNFSTGNDSPVRLD